MILDYVKVQEEFWLAHRNLHEEVLLDTGGGLKKAAWFFKKIPRILTPCNGTSPSAPQRRRSQLHRRGRHARIPQSTQRAGHASRATPRNLPLSALQQSTPTSCRAAIAKTMSFRPAWACRRSEESVFRSAARVGPSSKAPAATRPPTVSLFRNHVISPASCDADRRRHLLIIRLLRLSAKSQDILAFRADQYYWRDLGRPAD